MNDGSLTNKQGHLFHVTNTNAIITLNNVNLVNEDPARVRQMGSKSVILQVPYYFTWVTDCYRIGWDVASNHRSSSDGHVVADGDTR